MAETAILRRNLDREGAIPRLRRLGARAYEPARYRLWAVGVGSGETPSAWLAASRDMSRAMLLPGELPLIERSVCTETLWLEGGASPCQASFERLWLWERLSSPRRWGIRVRDEAPRAFWLPLWLGYSGGRTWRLVVISGLSGESLGALKPSLLQALKRRHASPLRSDGALDRP